MIIAVSGVPGTGKTTVASKLAEKMDMELIELKKLAKEVPHELDKRGSIVVEPEEIEKKLPRNAIIEGLNAHEIESDELFVLRTRPDVLKKRLETRKWPAEKIIENIQAEILDEITIEAMQLEREFLEINTTGISPEQTADLIAGLIKEKVDPEPYKPGKIDWSEEFKEMLIK